MPDLEPGQTHLHAGRSVLRPDLIEKVTGAAQYCVDIRRSGMLHAKIVRSRRAHARIASIDTSAARAMSGVVAVIVASDLAGLFARFGHIVPDHEILASGKVRYYGEPVAIVVADTEAAASDALDYVDVDYEDLPAVMSAEEALAPGAPLVHEEQHRRVDVDSLSPVETGADQGELRTSNVAHEATLEWGDVDSVWPVAAAVVENRMHYPMLYAYAMEPYNAVASFDEGRLEVDSTAQHPFMVRDDLARIFSLPLAAVTVRAPYLGGGYGSKSYTKVEPLAAVASWRTGRPVKLVLDVEESIYTTRADSAEVHVRSAFDDQGHILAREIDIVMDSGAYADNSPLVVAKSVNRSFGPYRVPNLRVRGRSVYTNTSPASSYRGFGAPQGVLAGETNLEQAADRLGIDSAELRRRNLVRPGEEILHGKRGIDADLPADLEMVVGALREHAPEDQSWFASAMACSASDAGAFPVSTATVRVQADGSVIVLSGSTEMGQGSRSALAQIAAEELRVELRVVTVRQSDTGATAYERTTGASRTTTLTGLALQRACQDALSKLRSMAAEVKGCSADEIAPSPAGFALPGGDTISYGEVVRSWFGAAAGEVTGIGLLRREGATAKMPPFWEIGMIGVGCRIDPATGAIAVEQLVTVGDVGFAINPQAVEAQDLGAATQGLGCALFEELLYDGPQLMNPNIVDYRVPRMRDLPGRIDAMLAERRDGVGPYGAKGSGEGALNPIAAAVATAVARVVGRWPDRVPLTPERVWRLINETGPDDTTGDRSSPREG
ncbi:MAG: aldehyde oxidase [Acidimicrobiaceae bacterium]|jgi:CO/xanthine dehydrogenase Mo-binding subunit|nr:aldehyde oxidase [Acidimicrobiaceae bacterium]